MSFRQQDELSVLTTMPCVTEGKEVSVEQNTLVRGCTYNNRGSLEDVCQKSFDWGGI